MSEIPLSILYIDCVYEIFQMRFELKRLQNSIISSIDLMNSKLSKTMDGSKKSVLTFIESATTSIASSAITSAQNAAMQISKQLKRSMQHIGNQLSTVSFLID